MARTVKEMPESQRGQKYPWNEWFNGKIWELTSGEDFVCDPDSMRQQTYQAASKLGLSAKTRVTEDGKVFIQVTEREES